MEEVKPFLHRVNAIINPFLKIFLVRSFVYLLPLLALAGNWYFGWPYQISPLRYGLLIDLIGVIILSFSLVRTPIGIAFYVTNIQKRGTSNKTVESMIVKPIDGFWGTAYLFIGFVFQFFGTTPVN